MFGYIKPLKPQMKFIEYDIYKSAYCGLCRSLGKRFGPLARFTLSYDYAFAVIFKMALSGSSFNGFEKCRCPYNLKKQTCCKSNSDLDFISGVAIIMLYYKIQDDISDSGFFKRLKYYIAKLFVKGARRKAAAQYPSIDKAIADCIVNQKKIEDSTVSSIDTASDPTARALAIVFSEFSSDEKQKTALERFGYFLGRWIYIADAIDDLEKDTKSKCYNPFNIPEKADIIAARQKASESLHITLGELANAYVLIDFINFKPILDNIIYLGLPHVVSQITNPTKKEHNR